MMQTEPVFEINSEISRAPAPAFSEPEMTRTRCPGCQKLFAVETDVLNAMARAGAVHAEFACTGAQCPITFAIELPLSLVAQVTVPARVLGPMASKAADLASDFVPHRPESVEKVRANQRGIGYDRECPRCGALNVANSSDCVRCAIVFDKIHDAQIEEEIALGGTRELAALWDKSLEDYEDRIRHDRFLNACRDAGALSYAAKKYSQILVSAPQDDIARHMRNRVVAMISVRSESSRMPFRLDFRIPKFNSMALFGGSLLFFWGLMMPQLKNIMEIGLSLILLSIGVRLALRARI